MKFSILSLLILTAVVSLFASYLTSEPPNFELLESSNILFEDGNATIDIHYANGLQQSLNARKAVVFKNGKLLTTIQQSFNFREARPIYSKPVAVGFVRFDFKANGLQEEWEVEFPELYNDQNEVVGPTTRIVLQRIKTSN